MGVFTILNLALQAVQAGFELKMIVDNVRAMEAAGSTEAEVHMYLKSLAHKNQTALEQA